MLNPVVALFFVEFLLMGLIWAVWAVLNFWIWQKSKSNGNLLMLVGSAVFAVTSLINAFGSPAGGLWLHVIALLILTAGFYLSVKPMVAAHLAALQAKMKSVGSKPSGGGTPPSGGTPAS